MTKTRIEVETLGEGRAKVLWVGSSCIVYTPKELPRILAVLTDGKVAPLAREAAPSSKRSTRRVARSR